MSPRIKYFILRMNRLPLNLVYGYANYLFTNRETQNIVTNMNLLILLSDLFCT